jgi:hypothetical protein
LRRCGGCARRGKRSVLRLDRFRRLNAGGGGGCGALQQRARGFQVVAQLVHLGAGLGILGAHLFHQTAKLADLILQATYRANRFVRCRRGRGRGRLLRSAHRAEKDDRGDRQCGPADCRNRKALHTVLLLHSGSGSRVRHLAKREIFAYGPGREIEFGWASS